MRVSSSMNYIARGERSWARGIHDDILWFCGRRIRKGFCCGEICRESEVRKRPVRRSGKRAMVADGF